MGPGSAQQWSGRGWLYDGLSAARRPAALEVRNGWLGVTPDGGETDWWPIAGVTPERVGSGWRIEGPASGGIAPYVLIDDASFPGARSAEIPGGSWQWVAGAVFGGIVLIVFMWRIGLPWLAGELASTVPVEWEARLGSQIAGTLAPKQIRCDDPAAREALDKLSGALQGSLEKGREYKYDIILANAPVVNAFAAPGGSIVLYRGLVERMATPDEFAAVLAHEIQHVALRHSTRAIFRNFALQSALSLMLGDPSGLLAQVTGQLSVMKYMREDEEEADREGMLLMARAGFDPRGMTDMLESLSHTPGMDSAEPPAWLSSHPSPKARIAAIERIMPKPQRKGPALTNAEWKDLKSACPGR